MELLIPTWLLLCVAVAILAKRYDRLFFWWFVLSLILSPLLGFIFLLAAGPRNPRSVRMTQA